MKQRRCPITYAPLSTGASYSPDGLKKLSRNLTNLAPLPFNSHELLFEATKHAAKMSIGGVQPKLSAKLNVKQGIFEIVDRHGQFILKPPLPQYTQVPENEDVSMRMAAVAGIDIPLHGLTYNNDHSFTYFIKRFDRYGHTKKILVEDFAQLSQHSRSIKYRSSMEEVSKIIDEFCTFPMLEKQKLLRLTLFNFLIGNEDMHLKNFSLLTKDNKTTLSPAYDLLNTTIVLGNAKEEIALPLNGKKNNLRKRDLLDYFAIERMQLNQNVIENILKTLSASIPAWDNLLKQCFLTEDLQKRYHTLLHQRLQRLGLE